MRAKLNFIFRTITGCLIIYMCSGLGCSVSLRAINQGTCHQENIDEGYQILQSALSKENEINYIAETIVRRSEKSVSLVIINYVAHLNGVKYRHVEYRPQNWDGDVLGPVTIANQNGVWRCTKESIVKYTVDFIADDLFNVEIFDDLKPCSGEFRVLNNGNVNDEFILVERTVSNHDSLKKIQEKIQTHAKVRIGHVADAKIPSKGVTNDHDVVPTRVIYKISKNTGIIIENAYFNKDGKQVSSTRRFDKVTILKNMPMSLFELPKGVPFYFPKNAVENWNFFLTL